MKLPFVLAGLSTFINSMLGYINLIDGKAFMPALQFATAIVVFIVAWKNRGRWNG